MALGISSLLGPLLYVLGPLDLYRFRMRFIVAALARVNSRRMSSIKITTKET